MCWHNLVHKVHSTWFLHTKPNIWKDVSLQRLLCFLLLIGLQDFFNHRRQMLFKFEKFAHNQYWNLEEEILKKRLSLIFFCRDYKKICQYTTHCMSFCMSDTFIPNRCHVCTLALFFFYYNTHTMFFLLLTVCTGAEWSWCSKGIFLSVIDNIVFPLIPYSCAENKCLYTVYLYSLSVCACAVLVLEFKRYDTSLN